MFDLNSFALYSIYTCIYTWALILVASPFHDGFAHAVLSTVLCRLLNLSHAALRSSATGLAARAPEDRGPMTIHCKKRLPL